MIRLFRGTGQSQLSNDTRSKYLFYMLGEIALVVVGILIALQINNWNDERKITADKKKTLLLIKKEIMANQSLVKRTSDYHEMVRDTLTKIEIPKDEEATKEAFQFWRGLQIFRLRNSAFQTAVQAGITKELDIKLSERLNAMYTLQDAYNDFSSTASQGLYNLDFSSTDSYGSIATFISMVMTDLYYFEKELMMMFDDSLMELETLEKTLK